MYVEDYFSVELLKESPLKLYEAQYLNMSSQLDQMISEDVIVENKVIDTFKHWVSIVLKKLREFKKEFKRRLNNFLAQVAKAKGDEVYENVKIPCIKRVHDGGAEMGFLNTNKKFDFNNEMFSDWEIDHPFNYVQDPDKFNGPYALNYKYVVGEEWDETNNSFTKKEFEKITKKMGEDVDRISKKIENCIEKIRDYAAKNFYDKDNNVVDTEGLKRSKDAIAGLEKMDKANHQYYLKFIKQS